MVDIINLKVNFMEVDKETLKEEEVVKVVVEVIKVNNQITSQIATIGKPRHMVKNCYQREHDARNGKLQQRNYASTNNQGDE